MELFFALSTVFIGAIAALVKASAPIVTTAITQNAKTERKKISSGADLRNNADPHQIQQMPSIGINRSTRTSKLVGLVGVLLSISHLAFLQFSSGHETLLSVGSAAAIAQAFGLFLMGIWLLFER